MARSPLGLTGHVPVPLNPSLMRQFSLRGSFETQTVSKFHLATAPDFSDWFFSGSDALAG